MPLLKRPFGKLGSGTISGTNSSDASGEISCGLEAAAAQRVRVGLTGLATIFLLVMIATVSLKPLTRAPQPAAPTQEQQAEPLAVLGVAPGAGPTSLARVTPAAPQSPQAALRASRT